MRILFLVFFSFIFLFGSHPDAHSFSEKIASKDSLTSTDSILQFWLRPCGVDDNKPFAKIFYFWTSKEELDSVQQQHSLLRTQSLDNCFLRTYLDFRMAIDKKKLNNNPVINYLREGTFGRMRSAWPCFWSGMCDTSYASETQLVKVELEDSSLIVVFRPQEKKPVLVYDLNGTILSQPEIEKRKSQIAVIFYSDHIIRKLPAPRVYKMNYYERTFFLCNESMIKTWTHNIPDVQQKVYNEIKYLLLLDAYFGSDVKKTMVPGKNGKNVIGCWKGNVKNFSVAQYFFSTQQFADSESPEAFPFEIDQIIGALRYRFPRQVYSLQKFPSRGIR